MDRIFVNMVVCDHACFFVFLCEGLLVCLWKRNIILLTYQKNSPTTRFGNIFRQLREVEGKIKSVQEKLLLLNNFPDHIENQNKLLSKQTKVLELQDVYWKTKVKSNHLKLSDVNTSYYRACGAIRKNSNLITLISAFQTYFMDLF